MARFLTAGDVLINADLLAYASVATDSEGLHVRLGFARGDGPAGPGGETVSATDANRLDNDGRHQARR